MDVERDILETDVLIIGGGPAGLAAAYKLARLVEEDGNMEMPEVLIMEKGSHVGAHSLSGAVMDPRGLKELIPDFVEKGAPLEAEVKRDALYYLTENRSYKFPFMPSSLNNHGNFIVSLNKLTGWLGEQVEALGLDIYAGLAGFDIIVEDGRLTGIQTVDMGLNKEGEPKSNFEPGSIVKAKVTVFCEGVHGSLAKKLFEEFPELKKDSLPQSYLTGVKEIWEVPEGRIEPGDVIHMMGWPQPSNEYGGGWIYGMSRNMLSIGYTVGLNSPDATNDPHHRFQIVKTHPLVRKILDGGTMLHYGAKTIPDSGYYSIPKLYLDGVLLCGDSAGLLNPMKLKGIHLAIKSGIMAAETIFDALKKNDFSEKVLQSYGDRFQSSWIKDELYKSRNFHSGFEDGLLGGMLHAGFQMISGGRGLFDRKEHGPDSKYMLRIKEYKEQYGHPPRKKELKFDNKYLIDKLTDVYKSGTMHEEEQPSHLVIADFDICNNRCTEEYGNPCTHFCPAQVYEMVDDPERKGKLKLQLTPSNCVHCKTCDIADPYQIINWVTPQGGEGPNYENC